MEKSLLLLIPAAVFAAGLPRRIDTEHYRIETGKVKKEIRICVVSDLHCRRYGKNQSRIREILQREQPDLVIIPGDLFDYNRDYTPCFELADAVRPYPSLYVTGNHDIYLEDEIEGLKQQLREYGVHVLDDQEFFFEKDGDVLDVLGLADMGRQPDKTPSAVSSLFTKDAFRILISHRNNHFDYYGMVDCDLVISGHAHGGQWCIPFTKQGIYAPQSGFFPKHTHGVMENGDHLFYVSRGLASGNPYIPRLYNNPEVGILHIVPKE